MIGLRDHMERDPKSVERFSEKLRDHYSERDPKSVERFSDKLRDH